MFLSLTLVSFLKLFEFIFFSSLTFHILLVICKKGKKRKENYIFLGVIKRIKYRLLFNILFQENELTNIDYSFFELLCTQFLPFFTRLAH